MGSWFTKLFGGKPQNNPANSKEEERRLNSELDKLIRNIEDCHAELSVLKSKYEKSSGTIQATYRTKIKATLSKLDGFQEKLSILDTGLLATVELDKVNQLKAEIENQKSLADQLVDAQLDYDEVLAENKDIKNELGRLTKTSMTNKNDDNDNSELEARLYAELGETPPVKTTAEAPAAVEEVKVETPAAAEEVKTQAAPEAGEKAPEVKAEADPEKA